MGLLASLGLAAGTTALSYIAGKKQASDAFDDSMYGSALAFERSQEAYRSRYQDTMADMKKAGLNPILAASSGGFNVGTAPQMSAPKGYQAPAIANLSTSAREIATAKTETEKTKKTVEETATERKRQGLIGAQEDNALAEYLNIKQTFNKITAEAKKILADRDLKQAEKTKVMQSALHLKATLVKLSKIAKVYKGPSGTLLTYIQEILKSLNLGVAIVPGLKTAPLKAR